MGESSFFEKKEAKKLYPLDLGKNVGVGDACAAARKRGSFAALKMTVVGGWERAPLRLPPPKRGGREDSCG